MSIKDNTFEAKKKAEKRELILNHQVDGEAYILSSTYKWKNIVLINFKKIKREEMTLEQIIKKLREEGIEFSQSDKLVKYPVIECLKFIAKISKVDLDVDF
ncbi:hypothetical protein AB3Z07_28330 (plasmid) [Metabacillus halosaccharovorans]|uniref:hypothetical protein n=1 Tax=Metabacillus halosaccharovorans TaxID=930124 RepID=UPI00203C240A|nr:hypothetical protein [Metabacillus halosaccharovorans]MCM3441428.1 hypothetical protein [Metabacillus halosaccharovorans]